MTEFIYRDANSVSGAGCAAAGGCLDFFLVFANDDPPNTIIERATIASFDTFMTDVGYDTATPAGITLPTKGTAVAPATVDPKR